MSRRPGSRKRHDVRRLPDGRWVCGAANCTFSGTLQEALTHATLKAA